MKQLLIEFVVLGTSCHSPIVAAPAVGVAVDAVVEEADAVEIRAAVFSFVVPETVSNLRTENVVPCGHM